jgi:hypothetical protein
MVELMLNDRVESTQLIPLCLLVRLLEEEEKEEVAR